MLELDGRDRGISELLQQLSGGLSAYRLFPGRLEQPSFVAALKRIRAAGERVLPDGAITIDIDRGSFLLDGEPLPTDEGLERLALACYERRIQRLTVQALPDATELGSLYELLTTPLEEINLDDPSPVEASAISLIRITPGAGEGGLDGDGSDDGDTKTGEEPSWATAPATRGKIHRRSTTRVDERSEQEIDLRDTLTELATSKSRVRKEAASLYTRFQELISAFPAEVAEDPHLYERLQDTLEELPDQIRRVLGRMIVKHADDDVVAQRFVGMITDSDLARMLVDVSSDQFDPVVIATELVEHGVRDEALVALTEAVLNGREEAGTIITAVPEVTDLTQEGAENEAVARTVSDLLARDLQEREEEDLKALRAEFPSTQEAYADLGMTTLENYLRLDDDEFRLSQVLETWVQEVREALLRREPQRALRYVTTFERGKNQTEVPSQQRTALFEKYRDQVLNPSLLAQMIGPERDRESTGALVQAFGEAAVDVLLELLMETEDVSRRAGLMNILCQIAPDHRQKFIPLTRDERWFVVRNALIILTRSRPGEGQMPVFRRSLHHAHPAVRKEAIRGFLAIGGPTAAKYIRQLLVDSDHDVRDLAVKSLIGVMENADVEDLYEIARGTKDEHLRRVAFIALVRRETPEATEALTKLSSLTSKSLMPMAMRREAKAAMRERGR